MRNEQENLSIENIRHSLAHVLAMAVLKKFPKAKLGIGPVIEHGFYYDFKLPAPLAPEDLPEIEKTMRGLIAQHLDFAGENITPRKARALFADQPFKLDLIK
ncbi:MAG: threonyl-tRNA synthetase, partial [Parcubacteria group bacterium Greene0714_36]